MKSSLLSIILWNLPIASSSKAKTARLRAEASVVAVQYHIRSGLRLRPVSLQHVPNWIVKS